MPTDAKYMAAVLLAGVLLVGGYFASGHLTGASAAASSRLVRPRDDDLEDRHRQGARADVVKRVPVVVRKTIVHSSTAWATSVDTRVVTTPGGLAT